MRVTSAVGDIFAIATVVALNPLPVAATLLLLDKKTRLTSIIFMLGWVLSITGVVILAEVLSEQPADQVSQSQPIWGAVRLALGAALVIMAIKKWISSRKQQKIPAWMEKLSTMQPTQGFVLAFMLSVVNPKNLLLCISAGVTISAAVQYPNSPWGFVVFFVLLGTSTVVIPTLAYLVAPQYIHVPVEKVRTWVVDNNGLLVAGLLLFIGFMMIGNGFASF